MKITAEQLLRFLWDKNISCTYHGNKNAEISGFCSLNNLRPNSLTWIKKSEKYDISAIVKDFGLIIITDQPDGVPIPVGYNIIQCYNPKAAFFGILENFWNKSHTSGVASTSVVETKRIGSHVTIGHHCYIGPEVTLDDNVTIEHNVTILCRARIGSRTIIHSGAVIGTDGYGYYTDESGAYTKVQHFGGVIIGEDVEIGANTCIDRGTLDDTVIGNNVKIDNLCHIAHNVIIEENSLVIALSMLGGSVLLKKKSYIAPGALVMNQITVGENSLVGLGAVTTKDVPDHKVVAGVPAKVLRDNI